MSSAVPKILLVDDEADLCDTCERLLARLGFRCLTADNAPRAIAMLDSEMPDLVVTDLNLPIGDGFEVLRHARMHSPAIPVIIITAYDTAENAAWARAVGVRDYLRKPFSNHDLTEAIRRALDAPSAPPSR